MLFFFKKLTHSSKQKLDFMLFDYLFPDSLTTDLVSTAWVMVEPPFMIYHKPNLFLKVFISFCRFHCISCIWFTLKWERKLFPCGILNCINWIFFPLLVNGKALCCVLSVRRYNLSRFLIERRRPRLKQLHYTAPAYNRTKENPCHWSLTLRRFTFNSISTVLMIFFSRIRFAQF